MDALDTVVSGSDVDPACRTGVSSLQSIIPQCWDFDPAQRPPASRISQCIAINSKAGTRLGPWGDENTFSLNGTFSSSHPSNRRLSSPQAAQYQYILPSLDPSDSPPPRAINGGNPLGRSRSSTQAKDKKGMRSLMSGFLTTTKQPLEISHPYDPVTLTHVTFNSSTGGFNGLPKEWQQILQEHEEREKNPQAAAEILQFSRVTSGAPGRNADNGTATSRTTDGPYVLGEGFQNPRAATPPPPAVRAGSSNVDSTRS
ncbi:signal transducing kinase of the PAK, partial [Tulasnella sp. UAMH 9824]